MFKVKSLALTTALFGLTSAQSGCYPAYNSGTYAVDDYVSATRTVVENEGQFEQCSPAGVGTCPASGQRSIETTTTTSYNFKCLVAAWCSQSAYDPVGVYFNSNGAWENLGVCTGSQPAPQATVPAPWASSGCPSGYKAGTAYDAGDVVAVPKSAYTAVYACREAPTNQFCGMSGYEPGTGLYSDQAWDILGSCSGTLAPTDSPSFETLEDAGGCPGTYALGEDYEPGDRVSKMGFVYECKAAPLGLHCPQDGYEPGGNTVEEGGTGGTPDAWKDAWSVVGYCSGTITPTTSPVFVALPDMGGCPNEWESKTTGEAYEEGDTVSVDGKVFACKAWPFSAHCGQAGYEPLSSPDTAGNGAYDAWKDAWTLVGHCSGSIGPTGSPSVDPADLVGACPDEWSAGNNVKYEEGDMVSVTVSTVPLRKVAYKCKAWPYSGHCGQYSPTTFGGPLGWTLAGSCDGSIGPTSSPSFDTINIIPGSETGCPLEYNVNKRDYEAGETVSYTVSTVPERKIVLECREWPNTGYCNQAGFKPGSTYQSMAWRQLGYCDGTIAPTPSPTPYDNSAGQCTYELRRDRVSTTTPTVSCAQGSSQDCTCTTTGTGSSAVTTCERPNVISDDLIANIPVNNWSNNPQLPKDYPDTGTSGYQAGDYVRVSNRKYKCRQYPNENWCNQASYAPENPDYPSWTDAWVADGTCP